MRHALKLHPDSRPGAATGIEVDVARPHAGNLLLHYFVAGTISDLVMPPVSTSMRTDELWRHTCFEAFVRPSPGEAYYEFNFAPSTRWAAYRFSGARRGMHVAGEIREPHIDVRSNGGICEMRVSLDLPSDAPWRLGVSAVIEETSGRKSYWALAHPPGKADFHHSDCFTLELPAPLRS